LNLNPFSVTSNPSNHKSSQELFSLVDTEGDGDITYKEFGKWVRGTVP
jgi:Ca2+-binding EF-hand superfamily protein